MVEHGRSQRRQRGRIALLAASLAIVVAAAGVWIAGDGRTPAPVPMAAVSPSSQVSSTSSGSQRPVRQPAVTVQPAGLRLSAGRGQQAAPPVDVVTGKPLSSKQIGAVIDRLPVWTGNGALAQPFNWPTQTSTTPPAGKSVAIPFPGNDTKTRPDPAPTGPLQVLRMQPQGAVSVAPFASVTFDRPMVPIATVGQLTAAQVPVTITPKPAGTWQWIGTSTLRFAADSKAGLDRLPMATDFTITVPAGTRAADGTTLARAARATFSTPAPTVKHFQPTGASIKLDPVFLAVFDQRIDPKAVLRNVIVSAGDTSWPVRLATAAEVAADPSAAPVVSSAPDGRALAFRPVHALPVNEAIKVTFKAGTPSAEGPRTTARAAVFSGRTYAPLTLVRTVCGDGGSECQPSTPLSLVFSNALDPKSFDPTAVRISPAIPGGATVTASGQTMVVQGATQADVTYRISVPNTVRDVFGQRLAAPAVGTITIAPATPRLDPFPQPVTTLDPMVAQPSITVNTLNRKEFRERVFAVSTSDWPAFQRLYVSAQQSFGQHTRLDVPSWPVLVDRVVAVGGSANRLVSTKLDLSKAMSGSTGQVVVVIEPTARETFDDNDLWQNVPTMTWAQSTTLGLDALNDATNLRA